MQYETAGDPSTGLKWTRRTTEKIAVELKAAGITVSSKTVAKILKKLGFSLKVNQKKIALSGNGSRKKREQRNEQFNYICQQRHKAEKKAIPVISVDTKKKELIGNFMNAGNRWERESTEVNDHDFPSWAGGKASPYGIYDTVANRGSVYVGTSYDTAAFAVYAIQHWWRSEGRKRYPEADELLILADNGGSNSPRCAQWKYELQKHLCNGNGIRVTVCHFPPGASKWNPIEHRLFSEISKNWKGTPLTSYEIVLKYIRKTKTTTGLRVNARLVRKTFRKNVKVSDENMKRINLKRHKVLPCWNYTLRPEI